MPHQLVQRLRFTRNEFQRGLEGLTADDAQRRLTPMNCISWIIGHMASQEQRFWLNTRGQNPIPQLNTQFAFGSAASTPPLAEVWEGWRATTTAADPWLDTLDSAQLAMPVVVNGESIGASYGSLLLRTTYHYWYHTGESLAIRQMLGHSGLPDFVGDIDGEAPYAPE